MYKMPEFFGFVIKKIKTLITGSYPQIAFFIAVNCFYKIAA